MASWLLYPEYTKSAAEEGLPAFAVPLDFPLFNKK